MKTFVMGNYDCITGELSLKKTSAESAVVLLMRELDLTTDTLPDGVYPTEESLKAYASDGDVVINVIEI